VLTRSLLRIVCSVTFRDLLAISKRRRSRLRLHPQPTAWKVRKLLPPHPPAPSRGFYRAKGLDDGYSDEFVARR
jgi:hypothetical protein